MTLYMLLSGGLLPFENQSTTKLMDNIIKKEPNYEEVGFKMYSSEGLDLVKKMLNKDPKLRPTAEECIAHSWLSCFDLTFCDSFKNKLRAGLAGEVS